MRPHKSNVLRALSLNRDVWGFGQGVGIESILHEPESPAPEIVTQTGQSICWKNSPGIWLKVMGNSAVSAHP